MTRIANATTERDTEECEAEVTPAMVEVGAVILRRFDDRYHWEEDFAARIYKAMVKCRFREARKPQERDQSES
jgi:hypothetical protein